MANGPLSRIVGGAEDFSKFKENQRLAPLKRREAATGVRRGELLVEDQAAKNQEFVKKIQRTDMARRAATARAIKDPIKRNQELERQALDLESRGIDSSDTRAALESTFEEQNQQFDAVEQIFQQFGDGGPGQARSRPTATDIKGRRRFLDSGKLSFPDVETPEAPTPQQKFDQDQDKIALAREQEARVAGKLSSPAENALLGAQDAAQASDTAVSELLSIANEFENLDPETIKTGFAGRAREAFKNFLGTEDDLTRIRKRYNQIVNNQVMQNLPPGVASDKDIQIAFSGFLKDTADTKATAAFLRGLAKMERINGKFNSFKADWISKEGNTRGMFKAWKEEINVDSRREDVKVEGRFNGLIAEGKTPEEAAAIMAEEGF